MTDQKQAYWAKGDIESKMLCAHDGAGLIESKEIIIGGVDMPRRVEFVRMPPKTSIGRHHHAIGETELYVILDGTGILEMGVDTLTVAKGHMSVIWTGEHALTNSGATDLELLVVDLGEIISKAGGGE